MPTSTFAHLARLPRPLQLPAAALAGIAFPVCECGSVPVARRLASKGLAPSAAVTFMLAAPILNPVVVASTFVAYRGRDTLWVMVLGRMGLGFLVAVAVGWVVGNTRKEDLLKPRPDEDDVDEEAGADEPRLAPVHLPSQRRLLLHGSVPGDGSGDRGGGADVRAADDRLERGQPAGALAPGDDGARVPDVALLRVGRVRGGIVHAVRARGAARVPGVGADDRPEARRALRRHVQQGVRPDGDGDRRRGDAWPGRCGCRWCSDDGASGDVAPRYAALEPVSCGDRGGARRVGGPVLVPARDGPMVALPVDPNVLGGPHRGDPADDRGGGTADDGARPPARARAELVVLDAGRDRAPGRA